MDTQAVTYVLDTLGSADIPTISALSMLSQQEVWDCLKLLHMSGEVYPVPSPRSAVAEWRRKGHGDPPRTSRLSAKGYAIRSIILWLEDNTNHMYVERYLFRAFRVRLGKLDTHTLIQIQRDLEAGKSITDTFLPLRTQGRAQKRLDTEAFA